MYVGNVSWTSTWADLKDHFISKGISVVRADIPLDGRGRSRGFGEQPPAASHAASS